MPPPPPHPKKTMVLELYYYGGLANRNRVLGGSHSRTIYGPEGNTILNYSDPKLQHTLLFSVLFFFWGGGGGQVMKKNKSRTASRDAFGHLVVGQDAFAQLVVDGVILARAWCPKP